MKFILNSEIVTSNTKKLPIFNLQMPFQIKGVSQEILDPRNSWKNEKLWEIKAKELANLFINNFKQFTDNDEGSKLVKFGPIVNN